MTKPEYVAAPECGLLTGPKHYTGPVRVALLDPVDPRNSPSGRNASEEFLFRHLYETLIAVDCLGEVRPALAESWKSSKGGARWTFRLRSGARFSDGTPITADDVVRSWRDSRVDPMIQSAGIDSVRTVDKNTLRIYFNQKKPKIPLLLSAPAFAVTRINWGSRWPHGTGPYRIVEEGGESPGEQARAITVHPIGGGDGPVIRFIEASGDDPRDLLEDMIDVLVTADPMVIEYAAGRADLDTIRLPWDRTYVLISTSRAMQVSWGGNPIRIPPDILDRLARDAVRGDARGYRSPAWWEDLGNCRQQPSSVYRDSSIPQGAFASTDPYRILYRTDDPVARDLAERIVALAAANPVSSAEAAAFNLAVPGLGDDSPGVTAEGVSRSELEWSLWSGEDFAYILPFRRWTPDPCHEIRMWRKNAKWLGILGSSAHEAFIPLVDTRPHVIVRMGRVGLIVDGYGQVLIGSRIEPED
jgi:hypothetical protein